jgi:hypothetical protein
MIDYHELPEHMRFAAQMYIEHGQEPGDFLRAVLENNLVEAYGRADDTNTLYMREWASWLYNEAPLNCWGNKEKVDRWIDKRGFNLNGL